jgi:hypothetical protein
MAAINLTTASKLSQTPFSTLIHTFVSVDGDRMQRLKVIFTAYHAVKSSCSLR